MSLIYKTKFRPQGNMILIKDRHLPLIVTTFPTSIIGKYDTYKGSTRCAIIAFALYRSSGKYDTYKGSTRNIF